MNTTTNHPQQTIHRIHNRRGVAMMLVMVAILITGGMALAYFGSRDNSIAISTNLETAARARSVADSGLELAITILETNTDWRTGLVEGVLLGDYALGEGLITITLLDADTQLPPTESTDNVEITAVGSVGGLKQIIVATATVFQNGDGDVDIDLSEFGLFSKKLLEADGGEVTIKQWSASPAFDSNYTIQVGTLEKKPLTVNFHLSDKSEELTLFTIQDASSMVTDNEMGEEKFSDKPIFLKAPEPPKGTTTLTLQPIAPTLKEGKHGPSAKDIKKYEKKLAEYEAELASGSGTFNITEGNYKMDRLELIGGTVNIEGDVTITVKKSMSLTDSSFILAEGATLTLYVEDDVAITSSYFGGEDQSLQSWIDPNRVKLYGTDKGGWEVSGDTLIKGEIYAPKGDITMDDNATIAGRIAAERIYLNANSTLLYDPILDNGGFADPYSGLYDENGDLIDAFHKEKTISTDLINKVTAEVDGNSDSDDAALDWKENPTARPNDVIYTVVVYGSDPQDWETISIYEDPKAASDAISTITSTRWWERVIKWGDLTLIEKRAYRSAYKELSDAEQEAYLDEYDAYTSG